MKANKRLIVTADDFGLTEGVNQAVIRAHREGIVTSASLMIDGGAAESAIALARQYPSLDVGLHLNLTEKPFALAATRRPDLEHEIRTQIERVLRTGLAISHIDGHKHVHVIPVVFKVLRRVAAEFGIRALRTLNSRTPQLRTLLQRNPNARSTILKQYIFAHGARFAWRLPGHQDLTGPDRFYGITETGFLDLAAFTNIIRDLPLGTHEMMCHPGYLDDDLRRIPTRLLKQREFELEMLTCREVRCMIEEAGVQLASYRDLVEGYGNSRTDSLLDRCSAL